MDRKEAIERIQEVMTIIRTQHMCKDMDGECTTEDRETYIQRFEALRMAIEALQEPEIVHCKDCKLRKLEECAMQYECDCGEQHSWENDNDYCSWGIKAGEQNGQKRSDRICKV